MHGRGGAGELRAEAGVGCERPHGARNSAQSGTGARRRRRGAARGVPERAGRKHYGCGLAADTRARATGLRNPGSQGERRGEGGSEGEAGRPGI